ncbi:MAG: hypothetical protein ACW7DY_21870, partial [Paraglaciecola chathamensis]
MNQLRGGILPEEMGIHTGFGYVQRLVIRCACLCTSFANALRAPSTASLPTHFVCQACALLIYALRASGTASLFMGFAH